MKLAIPPALILVIALSFGASTGVLAQSKNCKAVEDLTVESSWKSTGAGQWTLTLKFDDARLGDYAVMVTRKGQEPKLYKNKEKEFEGLKTGFYDIYIVDRKGCSKQLNLNIK
jgi:hypothetical protein